MNSQLLFVAPQLPTPDRDAGSLRSVRLLQLLQELAFDVTAVADRLTDGGREAMRRAGVTVSAHGVKDCLEHSGNAFGVIVVSTVTAAHRHLDMIRAAAPRATVIFDTVDLHFVREFRAAKVTGNALQLKQSLATRKRELQCVERADWTWVVTAVEKDKLSELCPRARVAVVSNIHDAVPCPVPFDARSDLLFVGSFLHAPNGDAMLHFGRTIWPVLRRQLPGVRVHVVGEHPPAELQGLATEDFLVTGHVPDLVRFLRSARLSVAPLRFGAGVKGKVLQSLAFGLPVVGTTIAMEGIPGAEAYGLDPADTRGFCQEVEALYTDREAWNRRSAAGRELVAKHFSRDATRRTLRRLLASPATP